MSEFKYPVKVYLLVAAFGLMTVVFATARLGEANAYVDPYPFRTQYARLAGVKSRIGGQRVIGYLSNLKPGEKGSSQLYFPTQYVMAPTLLAPFGPDTPSDFVLGNFTRQQDYAAFGSEYGLEVVQEFPMGVVLYRRRESTAGAAPPDSTKPR